MTVNNEQSDKVLELARKSQSMLLELVDERKDLMKDMGGMEGVMGNYIDVQAMLAYELIKEKRGTRFADRWANFLKIQITKTQKGVYHKEEID